MKVSVVANGVDDIIDLIHNIWGVDLPTRVAPVLQQRGYQVLKNEVTEAIYVTDAIVNTYPYQLRLELETGVNASSTSAIHELIRSVLLQVTGYEPAAIAVTSAGQDAPDAPAGVIDRTIGGAGQLVSETVTLTRVLQVAIAVGAVVVLYWAVTNPARVARLVRA